MKIDKRKNYYLTLDTETGSVDNPLIYDIGWAIHDKDGNIFETYSFLTEEFYTPGFMATAYFSKKQPLYNEMLATGEITKKPFREIIETLNKSIKDIPNLTIGAYNMSFDLKALKATAQKLGITGKLLKKSAKVQDIRSLCMETICNKHKSYERFAKENSLVTPGGNLSTTAETLFKYLTKDIEFIEDHTALSDSLIEAALWAYALRQKTKYERGIPESTFHLLKKAK